MQVGAPTAVSPATCFHYLYKDERLRSYERSENKLGLSLWQLSADGMAWVHGDCHIRMFDEKGLGCPLPERPGFVIVEISLGAGPNRLYFIDADDNVLPHERLPENLAHFEPYDAFVTEEHVKVLHYDRAGKSYYDAQVDYDPTSLKIVHWGPTK